MTISYCYIVVVSVVVSSGLSGCKMVVQVVVMVALVVVVGWSHKKSFLPFPFFPFLFHRSIYLGAAVSRSSVM